MKKLLVCIDGSGYADNICQNAAWVAERLDAKINLLHVLPRHSDYAAPSDDHTGSIGLGARSDLLNELTKVDEERGRLEQEKGNIILEHGVETLKKLKIKSIDTLHRRGDLAETVQELEKDFDMVFIAKRGEQANRDSEFLGSNLEKVARAIHTPLFVVSSVVKPIKKFLIAYDGKDSIQKAINSLIESPLLKGLDCHLLSVQAHEGDVDISASVQKLKDAGYTVTANTQIGSHTDDVIASYVTNNDIDLLVAGAYSHSRLHGFILGSTTASLIKKCHIPLLMFR